MTWFASQDICTDHATLYTEVVDPNNLLSYHIDDIITCDDDKDEWIVIGLLRGFEGHNKYILACCLLKETIKQWHLKPYPVSIRQQF